MLAPPRHVFFVGPRKTGTTTIYDVLKAQNVRIPRSIKETFFFEQPKIELVEYKRRFELDPVHPFVEVSPSYFTSDNARDHLSKYFPDAWIVITLRDPVKRSLSAISHAERIGLLDLAADPFADGFDGNKHIQNILYASNFEPHVKAWANAFPGRVIIMKQNGHVTFDPETISKTATACGIPFQVDAMLATRSNAARRSRSPALLKRGKVMMRLLERLGLGGARRVLKPMSAVLYRPYSHADDELTMPLTRRLHDSIVFYNAQPQWQVL